MPPCERHKPPALRMLFGLAILTLAFGCGKAAPIEEYTIPKSPDKPFQETASAQKETPTIKARLLAVMIPQGDSTWFFKLTGPEALVEPQLKPFADFVGSINFPTPNTPKWTLPANWSARGPSGIRYATLMIPTPKEPLEVTVFKLPTSEGDYDQYLVDNINRWRRQDLGLPDIGLDDLSDSVEESPLGTTKTYLVNMRGWTQEKSSMKPPFANAPFAGGAVKPPVRPSPSAPASPTYDVPKEWSKVADRPLSIESFGVKDGEQSAFITIIPLGPIGDTLPLQIDRWRGQVQSGNPGKVEESLHDVQAGDITAKIVKLVGPKDADDQKGMLVGIVSPPSATWYFKLFGDADLVLSEEARFKMFIQSVRFSTKKEAGDE